MNGKKLANLWKQSFYHKLVFFGVAAFLLIAGGWGITYGFLPKFVSFLPKKGSFLSTAAPVIEGSLDYLPLAEISHLNLKLDGKDVSSSVILKKKSFKYKPSQPLSEGKHTAEVDLYCSYLLKRKISFKWDFVTDTIPPHLDFAGLTGNIIGSQKRKAKLEGWVEPYSLLKVKFNGRSLSDIRTGKSGRFVLNLFLPKDKNQLKVVAYDRAKNKSDKDVVVVYDTSAPRIVSLEPAPGATSHTDSPSVRVKISEPESAILSAKLTIDNTVVRGVYEPKDSMLVYIPRVYFDGSHRAAVEITDAAGNVTKKEWVFKIDSTKIVIRLSQRRLYLYKGGVLQKSYLVAIGSPAFPTPKGKWRIINKRKNPSWHNPGSDWAKNMPDYIPPGPDNPLGQRALDLSAPAVRIHGTPNIGSVGRAVSHACIRMYPWDIEELFELVSVGTPVIITD